MTSRARISPPSRTKSSFLALSRMPMGELSAGGDGVFSSGSGAANSSKLELMIKNLIAAAAVVLVASLGVAAAPDARTQVQGHVHTQAAPGARSVTPMKPHTGPLPALPRFSFEPPRPMAVVQQVYEFAARHPEVLQYVPCYCGCERIGHNGNHDCFIKSRAANGRVSEWDSHGIGCTICIDVARDAMTLFNTGATPTAIRAAIDTKYGSRFPSSTPTPRPRR